MACASLVGTLDHLDGQLPPRVDPGYAIEIMSVFA